MSISRRDFVYQAGFATAAGLVGQACRSVGAGAPPNGPSPISGIACDTSYEFHNWSQTVEFKPRLFCHPRSESDIVAIVNHAMNTGTHVRTQGAGHSFAQILTTNDTLVTLDDVVGDISVAGNRATVPGGIRLKNLVKELKDRGLGMRNLGSITEQSMAGAFSTGTHGSGLKFPAISMQVVGVRLVDGNGKTQTITDQDKDDIAAARVNIGALGIITAVTVDCVPFYQLDYTAYLTTFEEILANIDQLVAENDRVLVWWLVISKDKRDTCVLITKNSVGHPVSDVLKQPEGLVGPCNLLSQDLPLLLGMLGKAPKKGFKEISRCRDDYYKALTLPLLPIFHRECEYAIPAGNAVAALKTMRDIVEEGNVNLKLPVEIRYVAQDDAFLSPCNNGPVCYIGASTLENSTEVFERFEPLMKSLGGRPHWGKCYTLTQQEVEKTMYPATYNRFRAIRNKYDPNRVFTNTLLTELFP